MSFSLLVSGVLLLGLFLSVERQKQTVDAAPKKTPLAFGVQLVGILFLLFSRLYRPDPPPTTSLQSFDHALGTLLILVCSANLAWMYFRLFYRYEQMAALQPGSGERPNPED